MATISGTFVSRSSSEKKRTTRIRLVGDAALNDPFEGSFPDPSFAKSHMYCYCNYGAASRVAAELRTLNHDRTLAAS